MQLARVVVVVSLALGGETWLSAQAPLPGSETAVVGLETEAAARPLGIDAAQPRFSWRLQSGR